MVATDLNNAFETAGGLCIKMQPRAWCIDLDACVAAGKVDAARQWISELVQRNENIAVVCSSRSKAEVVSMFDSGVKLFIPRNKLRPESQAAVGHELARAAALFILENYAPSAKKVASFQNSYTTMFSRLFVSRQPPANSPVVAFPE